MSRRAKAIPHPDATFKYTVIVTLDVEEGTEKDVITAVNRRLNHGYQYGDGVSVANITIRRAKVLLYDGRDTDAPEGEAD